MASPSRILDLNTGLSIKELGISINPKFMGDLIYTLIETIKIKGKHIGNICYESWQMLQYVVPIKYLNSVINMVFEFDHSIQFMNIVYYNSDQNKTYLRIFLSIDDEPTIKYLENDKSGLIPCYTDKNLSLKSGEYLINFAHCLMSYIGFYRMRLDDDSYLVTKNKNGEEIRTKLWLYYLIKNKKSWYAKFGYEPGNCTINEYNLLIDDVRSIKLDEISSRLKQVLSAQNKHFFDLIIIETAKLLVNHIGYSAETLYEYTINHCLEDFTLLTNHLFQSFFSRNLNIEIIDKNNYSLDCNVKSNDKNNNYNNNCCDSNKNVNSIKHNNKFPAYTTIDFPWFHIIKKLLVHNVIQINNNIGCSYYKLHHD